ncbi:4'-phosphopantetheinyl transferase family protein [Sphingomonas oryzagri]|uniref:4'-phosphopantetheinyl transferase superfamily protein n=1 Tax=Sphingomonas oryzagri TaxID=3042314 RepID=A0ABT6N5S2_9SPHN|nr:4'-phosphopantetheinyl transferase superfamily protein [Sphingomonas oryzagri]MDH7640443.1 4'-phosphopantetheinyl transferase superfamily protein [Sphingomonas oryzagri]
MAEITLHTITLDPGEEEIARLAALIDGGERQRAGQFRFERDRRRFIVRRARLREILGERIGAPPARLRFEAGSHGKPRLPGHPCHFSASHSGERMLVAVGSQEVGCDIERIVPDLDWQPIAGRFFTPIEQQALLSAPNGLRSFFRCWTRKEAFVKALGLGLSYPLDSFDVTIGEDARILRGGHGLALFGGWIADGYAFAVACASNVAITRGTGW